MTGRYSRSFSFSLFLSLEINRKSLTRERGRSAGAQKGDAVQTRDNLVVQFVGYYFSKLSRCVSR